MPAAKIEVPDVENPPAQPEPDGAAPPEDTTASSSGKYIQWQNVQGDPLQGSHRVIYAHEWKQAGVSGQNDVTWGPVNGYRVPVESLTDQAVKLLLTRESGFSEVKDKA